MMRLGPFAMDYWRCAVCRFGEIGLNIGCLRPLPTLIGITVGRYPFAPEIFAIRFAVPFVQLRLEIEHRAGYRSLPATREVRVVLAYGRDAAIRGEPFDIKDLLVPDPNPDRSGLEPLTFIFKLPRVDE